MGWGTAEHQGYPDERRPDGSWSGGTARAGDPDAVAYQAVCSCGWRSEREHPVRPCPPDVPRDERGLSSGPAWDDWIAALEAAHDACWDDWHAEHFDPLLGYEPHTLLIEAADVGGGRHFLDGRPVHAGSTLELLLGDGHWVTGRYEWSFEEGGAPIFHLLLGGPDQAQSEEVTPGLDLLAALARRAALAGRRRGAIAMSDPAEAVLEQSAPAPAAVPGELVAPSAEPAERFTHTLVARPQTQRTYRRACARFLGWLGPLPGPADLTAANVARYHAHLVAGGRSSATVKKDRAALNSFLRWLAEHEHEHVPAGQVREALAVRLPRAGTGEREPPKALSAGQYERLLREAKARLADDPLAGTRDLAVVLALGDGGLGCEELAQLERRDFLPARKGARLRALDVRHGKGDRQRRVRLSPRASAAIVRWDRERARAFGAPPDDAPLFVTLGRRRRDGTYTRVGGRCGQPVLADLLKRLGAAAELPDELRHPHALRHTCATELLRAGATVADVRVFLGHASVKTTSVYLASGDERQEEIVRLRAAQRSTLDEDRDAA